MLISDAKALDNTQIPQSAVSYLHSISGIAPTTLEMEGQTWNLISATEQIIYETDLSPHSPIDQLQVDISPINVVLRSISCTDLTFGSERIVRYAEVRESDIV